MATNSNKVASLMKPNPRTTRKDHLVLDITTLSYKVSHVGWRMRIYKPLTNLMLPEYIRLQPLLSTARLCMYVRQA